MTCDSRSSRELRTRSNVSSAAEKDPCCSSCNSQVCSSYLVGLLACLLVVGGVFLAFQRWDYMWLGVTAVGIALVFVGALLHYCGTGVSRSSRHQNDKRMSRHLEMGQNEHLLPTNANLNTNYSVSQLSLNMLPPYFPVYDSMSVTSNPDGGVQANSVGQVLNNRASVVSTGMSQIMQINGVSFLLLPIGDAKDEFDAQSLAASKIASGSLLQLQTQGSQIAAESTRSFLVIKPNHLGIPNSQQEVEPAAPQVVKAVAQVQTTDFTVESTNVQTETIEEEEPIYQVPRLLQEDPETGPNEPANHSSIVVIEGPPLVQDVAISTQDFFEETETATEALPASEANDNDVLSSEDERPLTPENMDDMLGACPPSYDEVAVTRRKTLGMPKFAYETM